MKKEIKFKKGDRVKVINCIFNSNCNSIGTTGIITRVFKESNGVKWANVNGDAGEEHSVYRLTELKPLKSPKKRVKKEKPQKKIYTTIEFRKRENGWTLYAENPTTFRKTFVFNTKARLLKWIENNI